MQVYSQIPVLYLQDDLVHRVGYTLGQSIRLVRPPVSIAMHFSLPSFRGPVVRLGYTFTAEARRKK